MTIQINKGDYAKITEDGFYQFKPAGVRSISIKLIDDTDPDNILTKEIFRVSDDQEFKQLKADDIITSDVSGFLVTGTYASAIADPEPYELPDPTPPVEGSITIASDKATYVGGDTITLTVTATDPVVVDDVVVTADNTTNATGLVQDGADKSKWTATAVADASVDKTVTFTGTSGEVTGTKIVTISKTGSFKSADKTQEGIVEVQSLTGSKKIDEVTAPSLN